MPNRLASETSPYLLQHADNPVDWYPWCDEAIERARSEDRPIFLSIGYSTCHWCHVMAHESFENPATAAVMNAHYVNIKLDREERPDLDRVYQTAHQVLTRQSGGWPLSVFLDPQTLVPFFTGTYFPDSPRHGLPSFVELLQRAVSVFAERREELGAQGEKLVEIFGVLQDMGSEHVPDTGALDAAREALGKAWDSRHGGFGGAPKFPLPAAIERLFRHWQRTGRRDRKALEMAMQNLTVMARGGLYDQLRGGFCRYCVDAAWTVPHFEKMLYDNGQLLARYADALAVGPDPLFETVVRETVGWLQAEMRTPEGAFHAALDADSDGEEGRYYVWNRREVQQLLDEDELLVIETLYGLDKPANFEGKWILTRRDAWRAVVQRLDLEPARADALLASARARMLARRETRVRPGRDDKVLTAWNGLAIHGLARAARVLDEPDWLQLAIDAAEFCRGSLFVDGRLKAVHAGGRARFDAYLDDHACLVHGLLEVLRVRWSDDLAGFARTLTDAVLSRFADGDRGGFFFTADDGEPLIHRPKVYADEALPSGNGLMVRNLVTLGHLYGEHRYLDAAERTLKAAGQLLAGDPLACSHLLSGLEASQPESTQVILHGPRAQIEAWRRAVDAPLRPDLEVFAIPNDAPGAHRPVYLPRLQSTDDQSRPLAFVCRNLACEPPLRSLEALQAALG